MPDTKRLLGVWSAELRDAGHPKVQEAAAELDAQGVRALWIPGLDGRGPLAAVRHLLDAAQRAVVFDGDPGRAGAGARRAIGAFFGFPAYRRNLSKLGFTDSDMAAGGSDRLVDAVVAHGTAEDIRARLQTLLDAGADHVAV